jgi:hypothetical protein
MRSHSFALDCVPACAETPRLPQNRGHRLSWAAVPFLLPALFAVTALAQKTEVQPADSTNQIVQRMVERNEMRAQHLQYCFSRRHYHVEYHGFGRSMDASMDVEATYNAASGKSFRVIQQSGSHVLLDHVLKKLLDTEQDDSRSHDAALTPQNYRFHLVGDTTENGRRLYLLEVEPRVKKKLLYRGKIWVDAEDYAVVRVEAQPAENPSFWIKSTEIHQFYAKTGEFWLPEQNRSQTKVRLGGTATLTIDYGSYQFQPPGNQSSSPSAVASTQ